MPKAYSYLRFSTPEQKKGDSFRRQTEAAQKYAREHGLDLDDKLTFEDEGVSAFRGKNLEEGGQLGAFVTAVQLGKVERGSYLLVESLDRISRQTPYLAMGPLTTILGLGITVVTLNDRQAYSHESMVANPHALMYAVMGFIRANEESAHKSMRLKAVWSQKRATAAQKPMTATVPAWLRLDKETGTFREVPECVDVVRRIFRDYLTGKGKQSILKALNREGVPVFSRETRKGPRQGQQWHLSYITRILENPAVIGTYTVHTLEHEGKKKTRRKAGDPIPNYFPAIIDDDTFQRAQAIRLDTPSPMRGRNANREDVKNIFGGVIRCGRCARVMNYICKGQNKKTGHKYAYLVCSQARYGAGCTYTAVPYGEVEGTFLRYGPGLLGQAPIGEAHTGLDDEIRDMDNALGELIDQLSALAEAYSRQRLPSLLEKMQEMEETRKKWEAQRDDLYKRAGMLADPYIQKRIDELSEVIQAEQLDRRRANALIRMVFSTVTVHPEGGTMDFAYKHGGTGPTGDFLKWGFPEFEAA